MNHLKINTEKKLHLFLKHYRTIRNKDIIVLDVSIQALCKGIKKMKKMSEKEYEKYSNEIQKGYDQLEVDMKIMFQSFYHFYENINDKNDTKNMKNLDTEFIKCNQIINTLFILLLEYEEKINMIHYSVMD